MSDGTSHRRHGRRKPYTQAGIRRLPCYRCGKPARHQWQICADGNKWHPVCNDCDYTLNVTVLIFMGMPADERSRLMQQYAKWLEGFE